jgi:hypothetical protein
MYLIMLQRFREWAMARPRKNEAIGKPWVVRDVPEDTRRKVRVYAAEHDLTIAQAVERLVETALTANPTNPTNPANRPPQIGRAAREAAEALPESDSYAVGMVHGLIQLGDYALAAEALQGLQERKTSAVVPRPRAPLTGEARTSTTHRPRRQQERKLPRDTTLTPMSIDSEIVKESLRRVGLDVQSVSVADDTPTAPPEGSALPTSTAPERTHPKRTTRPGRR